MIKKTVLLVLLILFLAPAVNADLDMGDMTIDNPLQQGPETYTLTVTNREGIKSLPKIGATVSLRKRKPWESDEQSIGAGTRTGQIVTFEDLPNSDDIYCYYLVGKRAGYSNVRSKDIVRSGPNKEISMTLVYYRKNALSTPKVTTPSPLKKID